MAYQLSRVRLLVSDVKAGFKFYSGVLVLPVSWGDEDSGYSSFKVGDSDIALFGRQEMADSIGGGDRPSTTEGQDRVAVVIQVEDVDKEYERLNKHGRVVLDGAFRPLGNQERTLERPRRHSN